MSWATVVSAAYVTGFLAFWRLRRTAPVSPDDAFAHRPLADKPADQSEQDPS